jgi:hypothetical protein
MTLWVLMISMSMNMAVAFKDQKDCATAAAQLTVPAMCVAFAADIPADGKKL